jgi:hypothetical protein
LSDQRWSGIASTGQATAAEAANTRKVCLGCHVTSDDKDGNNVTVTATDEVEGIRRNDPSYVNKLKLPSAVPEHAYIASPTAGQSCYFCHGNDYTGADTNNVHNPSGGAGTPGTDCKSCHNASKSGAATFRNIQTDFEKMASHVDNVWTNINSRDCENCHYALHGGYPKLWINATVNHPASPVDGTDYFEYTKGTTVKARVNELCLSCHNGTGYNTLPRNPSGATGWQTATKFSTGGSVPTPDVGPRWNAAGTTKYSKYNPSTYNVVPQIDKAYSPHRLPVTNETKPDFRNDNPDAHGYEDGTSYTDNTVGCLECHPAHGSDLVSGHGGDYSGEGLGKSGYMLTAENTKNESGNIHDNPGSGALAVYASEEELCWNCHVRGWDYRGDDTGTGRTRWQGSWQGDITWVAVKGGDFNSSHFYPNRGTTYTAWTNGSPGSITRTNLACSTCHDAHGIDTATTNAAYMVPALRSTWLTSPFKEDRPPSADDYQTDEGADWRLGISKKGIAIKYGPTASGGTATNKGARMVPDLGKNNPTTPGHGYSTTKQASVGDGYFIDENTFGVGSVSSTTSGGGWFHASNTSEGLPMEWGSWDGYSSLNPGSDLAAPDPPTKWWIRPKHFDGYLGYDTPAQANLLSSTGGATPTVAPIGGMTETVFAGLCLNCHTRSQLSGTGAVYQGHVAVAGWHNDGNQTKVMVDDNNRPFMHVIQRVGINNYQGVDGTWGRFDSGGSPSSWTHDGPVGYRWGVDPGWATGTTPNRIPTNKGGAQSAYHRFPCSKCHTPHASRLPRLMVTNCLDVGSSDTVLKNTSYVYPQTTIPVAEGEFGLPQSVKPWEFAVTCHADRDGKPARSTGTSQQWYTTAPGTSGWNDVTPW